MKKFLLAGLSIFSFMAMTEVANAQELSANISSNITLTEDVKLTQNVTLDSKAKIIVKAGSAVTIDLNGFKLTQASDNYAIDNQGGELTIVDSSKKGMIECTSNRSSCVRNNKTMEIKDTTIKSVFTAIKSEEKTNLTITGSNIVSTGDITGAIMNYGTALVENSSVTATGKNAVAIFALTYNDYSSKTTVNNSVLKATKAVETYYDDGASTPSSTVKNEVTITGGVIDADSKFNIREVPTSDGGKMAADFAIGGEITAPAAALEYAKEGTSVTLNSDALNVSVPEGVEVVGSSDENKLVVENEDGTVSVKQKADSSKLIELLKSLEDIDESLYTEESLKKFAEVIISVGEEVELTGPFTIEEQDKVDALVKKIEDAYKELVKVDSADKTDDTIKEAPNTYDGIMLYVVIGIVSLGTLGFAIKKRLFQ